MRVAQRMISRNYKRQINSSMTKQADALERSESGLAFKKLSDNVSAGSRAMHIQEQRYAATQQLNNVKDLLAEQKSIDSNLSSIHSILQKVQERVLTGMSEDWGATSREVIAQEIGQKMEQLLQFANSQYAGHTLFGGTNNSVPPFTVSDEGKLQFNGIDVDRIFKSAVDGKYYYYDPIDTINDNGERKYLIGGEEVYSADGKTFTTELGETYTINLDWTYRTEDGLTFTNDDGKSFIFDKDGGITQAVIGGVEYTYDEGSDLYIGADGRGFSIQKLADGSWGAEEYTQSGGSWVGSGQFDRIFEDPVKNSETGVYKLNEDGTGYDKVVIKNVVYERNEEDGLYYATNGDPNARVYKVETTDEGQLFTWTEADNPGMSYGDDLDGNPTQVLVPFPEITGEKKEVPNSGHTYADIGLGLKINNSSEADPRTAYQVSFSGLDILGCAGVSYDGETFPGLISGAQHGTIVSGNLYDLLGQIKNALSPNFDKNTLDDLFTQLVDLTDEVGMVRTDLGNRMEYLELTETRLDDDIFNMTTLETDLVSSDPAMEAIKMKECEYVWLALMQLGSKVLPASLLDFIS